MEFSDVVVTYHNFFLVGMGKKLLQTIFQEREKTEK